MDTEELIKKSIKKNVLHKLFSETLADKQQKTIIIDNIDSITNEDNFKLLLHNNLQPHDLLVNDENYYSVQSDYQVINSSGKVILDVSDNNMSDNNSVRSQEDYDNYIKTLIKVYGIIKSCDNIYTIHLNE